MKSHDMYDIWEFPAFQLVEMGVHMTFEGDFEVWG